MCVFSCFVFFCFFKQKPAYDVRISDWSSDVCSSDLLGANHPMGPLELADFIGLDTCLSIMSVLYDGLADSKYRPCPLLVKYVEAGWIGKKVGRGFYDYSSETPVPTR